MEEKGHVPHNEVKADVSGGCGGPRERMTSQQPSHPADLKLFLVLWRSSHTQTFHRTLCLAAHVLVLMVS